MRDRVVQGALQRLLEPLVAADVQPGSSGYRPQRAAQAAVERVAEAMASWQTRVSEVDLQAYFDNVRPHVLLATVATRSTDADVRHLFHGLLKASGTKGVPQGGAISCRINLIPLLSHGMT